MDSEDSTLCIRGAHTQDHGDRGAGQDRLDREARELDRDLGALAAGLGNAARAERERLKLTLREVALVAGLSYSAMHAVEDGNAAYLSTYVRIARALHLKPEFELVNPRRRTGNSRAQDPVHSAMGEIEAAHLRRLGFQVRLDEPFQHYHFAGRGDVVAWSVERAALLHIENKTEFPNLQAAFGAFNTKQSYLGAELAARLGVRRWRSETHLMAMLWSAEVLRTIRQHRASFESLDRDGPKALDAWWTGEPPSTGSLAAALLFDPMARRRDARVWLGMTDLATARPRYRNYADALAALEGSGQA
jgi:hypothetical protein